MAPAAPAPAPAPLTLEGRSKGEINAIAIGLLVCIVVATMLGLLLDHRAKKGKARMGGRPGYWVITLLLCSYAILVPGLCAMLISLNIGAMNSMSFQKTDDSMLEFISMLARTGGWLGAFAVLSFAILIPLAKICLLVLGEHWRFSNDEAKVEWSRRCIRVVQSVSKWACPDMFAYILLWFLIRSLNHPPTLDGLFQLGTGFTCYTMFCVGSTVSSLGIQLPIVPDKAQNASGAKPPMMLELFGRSGTVHVVVGLTIAFIFLFGIGLAQPCMALHLDVDALIDNGLIKASMKSFVVDTLHLQELAHAEVTVFRCIDKLVSDAGGFDANCIIGFVMLAVFVLVLTILDMAVLLVAAFLHHKGSCGSNSQAGFWQRTLVAVARVLKKLSMLDVMVTGVVIVVLSGEIYRSQGLVLTLGWGLLFLAGAEVCHYACYHAVSCLAKHPEPIEPQKKMAEAAAPEQQVPGWHDVVLV